MEYLIVLNAIMIILLYYIANFRKKDRLPEGKRFVYSYEKYKATVIIDHEIKCKNGQFVIDDKTVSGKTLAKACAIGMYSCNLSWNQKKIVKKFNANSSVYECVFVFLSKKNFTIASEAVQHDPDAIVAFALKYTKNYPYDGPYGCVINETEMKNSEIWAATPIHEYLHCLSHFFLLDWDYYHTLWYDKAYLDKNNKNISRLAAEKTHIMLNMY